MKRQQRFVEIILLLLLGLVVSFWGYRGYRFMQAHPLVNRVYRYQASSAAKAELTSTPDDYRYVVFGTGRYRGEYIRVDNRKQLLKILNHRNAYQAAFEQNGSHYMVRHHRLQMDLEDMPSGESYVRSADRTWTVQSDQSAIAQTTSSSLQLTSLHAKKQTISTLP
ncbi:MAG: hypothetical protein PUG58_05375 [Limosilactobacillus mucosae]|uniref:hypothetical protein n=1 Tax=Limosilactobacillus mucosae TaxID=97478 RepID=UPI00242C2FCB|nr:hypothetical protein [Limosilactobacillus mucosae]MCI6052634.1 hypothetical protein [Limosilactobacillus mucosae]MDD7322361.1 hypothetical protein [Limosilactobacillus mucosae]